MKANEFCNCPGRMCRTKEEKATKTCDTCDKPYKSYSEYVAAMTIREGGILEDANNYRFAYQVQYFQYLPKYNRIHE